MQLIDLTQILSLTTPVYPGDPATEFRQLAEFDKDGFTVSQASFSSHTGTHMDAPAHFVEGGKLITDYPPEKFFGRGILIDARGKKEIDEFPTNLPRRNGRGRRTGRTTNIVLVLTGWDKKYNEPEYYTDYPVLTKAFAEKLVELKVKMLGLDFPSPDKKPYGLHNILLSNDILILENLTNLEQLLPYKSFEIIALPAKFAAEAAPCRVIAKINK